MLLVDFPYFGRGKSKWVGFETAIGAALHVSTRKLYIAPGAALFFLVATFGFSQQTASQQAPGRPTDDLASLALELEQVGGQ